MRGNPANKSILRKCVNIKQLTLFILIILVIALTVSALIIIDSGSSNKRLEPVDSVEVEIPDDLHEAIHQVYDSLTRLEMYVSADIHYLSEKIEEAETSSDKKTVLLDYYSDNTWMGIIIYYNAETDEYSSYPLITESSDINKYIPKPSESELRKASNHAIINNCIFVPNHGYLNMYCKGIFADDGTYKGYYIVLMDTYVALNLHPKLIDSRKSYGDYAVFVTDVNGKIIYSSRQETIGETVSENNPLYTGEVLLKILDESTGAYQYTSRASYLTENDNQTEKITAWHKYGSGYGKYTVYAVKELNRPELKIEDAFELDIAESLNDVVDVFLYSSLNGIDKAVERINGGYYNTTVYISDYNGEIIASKANDLIGLTYLNNRGSYGYSYISAMIDAVEQGGGYIYYTKPVDGTVNTPASEYTIGYVLPLDGDYFVAGIFAADTDLIIKNPDLMSDVTNVAREILSESNRYGFDYVVDKINNNKEAGGSAFVEGLNTEIYDIGIADILGIVKASMLHPEYTGESITGITDVYGGSVTRRSIMLAKSGGGFTANLMPNAERGGFVDLWYEYVIPMDESHYLYVRTIVKTLWDELSPYLKI